MEFNGPLTFLSLTIGDESRVARVQVRSTRWRQYPSIRPGARAPEDSRVPWLVVSRRAQRGSGAGLAQRLLILTFATWVVLAPSLSPNSALMRPSRQSFLKRQSANRPVPESIFSESQSVRANARLIIGPEPESDRCHVTMSECESPMRGTGEQQPAAPR